MRRIFSLTRRMLPGAPTSTDKIYDKRSAPALRFIVAGLLLACGAIPSIAGDPDGLATERHDLKPSDKARVEKIVKPTTDFSKSEQFELMQGGAGTSKKRVNQDAPEVRPLAMVIMSGLRS